MSIAGEWGCHKTPPHELLTAEGYLYVQLKGKTCGSYFAYLTLVNQ